MYYFVRERKLNYEFYPSQWDIYDGEALIVKFSQFRLRRMDFINGKLRSLSKFASAYKNALNNKAALEGGGKKVDFDSQIAKAKQEAEKLKSEKEASEKKAKTFETDINDLTKKNITCKIKSR